MNRHEREIKSEAEIEDIIQRAQVCRIAFSDADIPYIVPVNFGYERGCLYFHSSPRGKKLDILHKNNQVCFEMETEYLLRQPAGPPCSWGASYRSVIVFGRGSLILDVAQKAAALNIITRHYGAAPHDFSQKEIEKVAIVKIEISHLTGKKA